MKNKKVLITGGGGFIRLNIARHLLKEGNSVKVLDNFMQGIASTLMSSLQYKLLKGCRRQNCG